MLPPAQSSPTPLSPRPPPSNKRAIECRAKLNHQRVSNPSGVVRELLIARLAGQVLALPPEPREDEAHSNAQRTPEHHRVGRLLHHGRAGHQLGKGRACGREPGGCSVGERLVQARLSVGLANLATHCAQKEGRASAIFPFPKIRQGRENRPRQFPRTAQLTASGKEKGQEGGRGQREERRTEKDAAWV